MFCRSGLLGSLALLTLSLHTAMTIAQPPGESLSAAPPNTVSGTGFVTVKERPTLMRMTIQLSEKAETLPTALEQLKDRREAALLQLKSLGAKQETIVIEPPGFPADPGQQKQQMEQVARMLRARGRSVPKGLDQPKLVAVSCQLTAEWPLDMATHEEVLTFAKDLVDKVVAADLAGTKEPKKLSPEAQELEEEMAEAMSESGYGNEQVNPGEPQFVYVARLPDANRDKAMEQAFAQAKTQAARLARAAGAELGTLSSLTGGTSQLENDAAAYYRGSSYQMRMMFAEQGAASDSVEQTAEAVIATPTVAKFQVVVQANFHLK